MSRPESTTPNGHEHAGGAKPPTRFAAGRFILIFALVSAAGIGLEYYLMKTNGAVPYRSLVARAASPVAGWFGIPTILSGTRILVGGRVLEVTPECSGIEPISIFIAGVLAFPCSRRKRLLGLAMGLVGVGLLNLARIAALAVVAGTWPDSFDPWHNALMHLFPLFAVLPLWLVWMLGRGGFVLKFLGCLAATSIVWGLTRAPMVDATLELAKGVHALVGAPAPFLLMEELRFWWLAPPAQLFVTLVLISSWQSRGGRAIAMGVGLFCLWSLVVLDVVAQSSPYLGPYDGRYVLSSILTKGHLIVSPVLFWLVLVTPPWSVVREALRRKDATARAGDVAVRGSQSRTRRDARPAPQPSLAPVARWRARWIARASMSLSLVVLVVPVLWIIASNLPEDVRAARGKLIEAVTAWSDGGPVGDAARTAIQFGSVQEKATQRADRHLYYFGGRLVLEDARGERDPRVRAAKISAARKMFLSPSIPLKAQESLIAELARNP